MFEDQQFWPDQNSQTSTTDLWGRPYPLDSQTTSTPAWFVIPAAVGPSAAERKAIESHQRASAMASAALHGVQPRNTHHRSLRGYADAPRRPCYRAPRGGR